MTKRNDIIIEIEGGRLKLRADLDLQGCQFLEAMFDPMQRILGLQVQLLRGDLAPSEMKDERREAADR